MNVKTLNLKFMVRDLNVNKKEELKSELLNTYPDLTNDELNSMDNSMDQLVETISSKTNTNKADIEKLLVDRLEFINSKHLI